MSLEKFTMETADELIWDAIVTLGAEYQGMPDKNYICNYLNVSRKTKKLHIENRIDTLLELNKMKNIMLHGINTYFINYPENLHSTNLKDVKWIKSPPIKMEIKAILRKVHKLNSVNETRN